jgi:hypothetical protein
MCHKCGRSYGQKCFNDLKECPVRCGNPKDYINPNLYLKKDIQTKQKV